jgi:hypothetical protein
MHGEKIVKNSLRYFIIIILLLLLYLEKIMSFMAMLPFIGLPFYLIQL